MSEQFPQYPELTEEAELLAQKFIDSKKDHIKKLIKEVSEEVLGDIYTDVASWIKCDSWSNFRQQIIDFVCDYGRLREHCDWDAQKIRKRIFQEYKEELIEDLNQDNLKKIKELEEQIHLLKKDLSRSYGYYGN